MFTAFAKKVRQAFTDAADQYDILTGLHKEIGRELVKKAMHVPAQRILDVGCGTGYTANKAKFFFPESRIVGLDAAEGMLRRAQHIYEGIAIDWLQADAQQLPFKSGAFDLIVSNLAYQWAEDLAAAWAQAGRVLSKDGQMYATLFGSRTCGELWSSLRAVNPSLRVRPLPSLKQAQEALQAAGFRRTAAEYELIKVEFKNVLDLIGWLRDIGANNLGAEGFFLGKQTVLKAGEHYRRHFPYHGGICATFEVIWVHAQK